MAKHTNPVNLSRHFVGLRQDDCRPPAPAPDGRTGDTRRSAEIRAHSQSEPRQAARAASSIDSHVRGLARPTMRWPMTSDMTSRVQHRPLKTHQTPVKTLGNPIGVLARMAQPLGRSWIVPLPPASRHAVPVSSRRGPVRTFSQSCSRPADTRLHAMAPDAEAAW